MRSWAVSPSRRIRPVELLEAFVRHVVPFETPETVLVPVTIGELNKIVVRMHAAKVHEPMLSPDHERHIHLHRGAYRIGEDPCMRVPVHITHKLEADPIQLDQHLYAGSEEYVIAAKNLAHVKQVLHPRLCIVVPVIGHQKRVHAEHVLHCVDLKIAVLATGNGDETVVAGAIRGPVLITNAPELLSPPIPVNGFALHGGSASGTDAVLVERQRHGGRGRVNAPGAVGHFGRYLAHSVAPSYWGRTSTLLFSRCLFARG